MCNNIYPTVNKRRSQFDSCIDFDMNQNLRGGSSQGEIALFWLKKSTIRASNSFNFSFRFVGAFCGMVYIFTLPSLVHMKSQKEQSKLTKTSIVLHSSLVVIGVAIFIGQLLTI